jgi:hypothetical protein
LLRKPSEYFKEDENISVDNSVQNLSENSEVDVNTFSEAFNSFKENISKIETLSEYSETLDDYKLNIEKVNFLSEKIEGIETEIQNFLTRKDLDIAVMSQLFVVEQSIKDIQSKVKSINQRTLTEIRLDASNLTKVVNNFINTEVPKYRKSLVETEVRSSNLCRELEDTVNQTVSDINEFVDNKYEEVSELIVEINESIVRNESYLKSRNQTLEDLQEHILTTFSEINLEKIEKKNHELSKKIKYIEEVFEKFDENKILNENLLAEPPSTTNQDPLTPLDKNFVTLDQLQEHYRLFINRIQQQLASIGGSGETKLKYLDDIVGIATNPSVYDGKFLKYKHEIKAFEFQEIALDYAKVAGIATYAGYATTAGISTNAIYAGYATTAGIATDATYAGYATTAGIATDATYAGYATTAGIATYSVNSGTSTSVIGGIASVTQLYVTGITTLGVVTSGNIYSIGIVTATQFSTGSTGIGINTDTISGPEIIYIDPSPVGVGTTSGIVRIKGDLYVDGTQFIVNSTTIELADFNVGIASTVGTNLLLDGAGIGIGSANIRKTFAYNNSANTLESSIGLGVTGGGAFKTGTSTVLTSTTLGSTVVNSSLTSVGTLSKLDVGNVNSTGIITANTFVGNIGYSQTAGIATFATKSGVSTDVIGGIASVTSLFVDATGITTLGTVKISSGIITSTTGTAVTFFGTFVGTASSAGFAHTAFKLDGFDPTNFNVAYASTAGIATYATKAGVATDVIGGIASVTSLFVDTLGISTLGIVKISSGIVTSTNPGTAVTFFGDFVGTASSAGFAYTAFKLQGFDPTNFNVAFASTAGIATFATKSGVSTDVIGGIASVTSLFVNASGISTLGTVVISAGIITATSGGIVTYFGDGSKLSNTGSSISTNTTNQAQFITYVTGTGSTSGLGVTTTGLVFNPSSNSLGIGTTNPTSKLTVQGNISVSGFSTFSGNVFVSGIITATDYDSASDIRLKENIQKIDNPIDKIIRIEGVTFDWKSNNKSSMGVIAQNIEKVLPQLVNGGDSKTVNYNGIIGLLIECVKTQQEQIDNLNRRLDDLSK